MNSGLGPPKPLRIETFDPGPSVRIAIEILQNANATHALAGRLAVWSWVPGDEQEFTKDVDFAVPSAAMPALKNAIHQKGFEPKDLPIGGLAIRDGSIRIDFIDRHQDFGDLFTEAVRAAHARKVTTTTEDGTVIFVVPPEYLTAMKLATGDPRDERDVERILAQKHVPYDQTRKVVRHHLGPAAANRLDHVGTRVGIQAASRYVQALNGKA